MSLSPSHALLCASIDRQQAANDPGRVALTITTPAATYEVEYEEGEFTVFHGQTRIVPHMRKWSDPKNAVADILEQCCCCPDWAVTRKATLALSACEDPGDVIDTATGDILLPEVAEWIAASDEDLESAVERAIEERLTGRASW